MRPVVLSGPVSCEVWPLTLFIFCLLFTKIGKNIISFVFILTTPSSLSQTHEGLFRAGTAPSMGSKLAWCVTSRTMNTLGHRGASHARHVSPRTLSKTADSNLDCVIAENTFFYTES